jgi:Alginate export
MGCASSARRPGLVGMVVLGLALQTVSLVYDVPGAWAQSRSAATEPNRPAYQIGSAGRFNEDWSSLRGVDLGATDDPLDRLKFIPLTSDQSVWLTIGGQIRERGEYFRHLLFGDSQPKDSDGYLLSRYRLLADLHVGRYFRLFAEGRSAFALDRELADGRTTSFVDEVDLVNGFADIVIPLGEQTGVTLRGGRQELIFGSQRLVGAGNFTNTAPRSWDGGSAYAKVAGWAMSSFGDSSWWPTSIASIRRLRTPSFSGCLRPGLSTCYRPTWTSTGWTPTTGRRPSTAPPAGSGDTPSVAGSGAASTTWVSIGSSRGQPSSGRSAGATSERGWAPRCSAIPCPFLAFHPVSTSRSTTRAATSDVGAASARSTSSTRTPTRSSGTSTTSGDRTSSVRAAVSTSRRPAPSPCLSSSISSGGRRIRTRCTTRVAACCARGPPRPPVTSGPRPTCTPPTLHASPPRLRGLQPLLRRRVPPQDGEGQGQRLLLSGGPIHVLTEKAR